MRTIFLTLCAALVGAVAGVCTGAILTAESGRATASPHAG